MTKKQIDLSEKVDYLLHVHIKAVDTKVGDFPMWEATRATKKDLLKAVIPVLEEIADEQIDITGKGLVGKVGYMYIEPKLINYLKELTDE